MKKGKIKNEIIDDSFKLDSDLDMGDFDFDTEPPKDDRSPVTKLGAGALQGVKEGLSATSFIKKTLKDTLPPGFGKTMDFSDKISQNVKSIYDDSVKEIKPALKEFKKIAAKIVPKDSSFVPKSVADMLKRWEEEKDNNYRAASKDEQRESILNIQLTEAFKEQFVQAAKDRSDDTADTRLQQGIELSRHRDIFGATNAAAQSLSSLDQYQRNITFNFQKKTLEVQFRQLFAMQDILEESKRSFALHNTSYEKIVKNTALPDYVKINGSEFRSQVFKNKFYETMSHSLFGGNGDYLDNIFKSVKSSIVDKVSSTMNDFRVGIGMADMASDQAKDAVEIGGPSNIELAGNVGGTLASQTAASWLGKKVKKHLIDPHEGIQRLGKQAEKFIDNKDRYLNDFRKSDKYQETYDDSQPWTKKVFNWFMRTAQEAMPGQGTDVAMQTTNNRDMDSPFVLTRRTDKTLNEIIPGYLSRILREVQVIRTGDNNIEATRYDFNKNEFVTRSQAIINAKKRLFNTEDFKEDHRSVDELLKALDPTGEKIKANTKEKIKEVLLANEEKITNSSIGGLINKLDPSGRLLSPEIKKQLKKLLLSRSKTGGDKAKDIDVLMNMIDGSNLSESAQKEFRTKLIKNSTDNNFADEKNLTQGLSRENRAEITKLLSDFFNKNSNQNQRDEFINKHNSLSDNISDPRSEIQSMVSHGDSDIVREIGLLDDRNQFKKENYLEALTGNVDISELGVKEKEPVGTPTPRRLKPSRSKVGRTVPSDINAKKDFKRFPGAKALDAIRKTAVSAWNYKKGKGDEASHVGPMAQTVNQTMGPDAAPNANKIDLVTMNGMNMAAIQELDKQQQEEPIRNNKKQTSHLTGIDDSLNDHLLNIRCLLEEIRDVSKAGVAVSLDSNATNFNFDFGKFKTGGFKFDSFKKWYDNIKDKTNDTVNKFANKKEVKNDDEQSKENKDVSDDKQHFDNTFPGKLASLIYNFSRGTGKVYNSAKDNVKKNAPIVKDKLITAKDAIGEKAIQTFTNTKAWYVNDVYDIYFEGEKTPRLYAIKILNGQYFNLKTKQIIIHQREITGPIAHKDDLGKILISEEDLPRLYTRNPKSLAFRLLNKVGDSLKSAGGLITKYTPSIFKFSKELIEGAWSNVKTFSNKAYSFIDEPIDIYVKGDELPTLLAIIMKSGGYFSCLTGKPVIRPGEIDGPIKGADGNTILSIDHIKKGLVDHNGDPIKTPLDKLKGVLGGAIKDGIRLGALAWEGVKTFGKKASKVLGNFFSEFSIEINGKKSLTVLEQIRDFLYYRFDNKDISSHIDFTPKDETKKTEETTVETKDKTAPIEEPKPKSASGLETKANELKAKAESIIEETKSKLKDIYVAGEADPRITEVKLKLGQYRDKITKVTIKDVKDITGAVIDELDKEVISAQEVVKLNYLDVKDKIFKKLGNTVRSAANSSIVSNTTNLIPINVKDAVTGVIDKAKDALSDAKDKVMDVYAEASGDPVLYAQKLKDGLYRDKNTDKVITHQSDITGEVVDEHNNTVIRRDQLKTLSTFNIETKGFKPLRLAGRIIKSIIKPLWHFQTVVAPKMVAWNFKMLGKGLKATGKLLFGREKVRDVFVDGEREPRLYATKLELGHYRDKQTNKVIYHQNDIIGEVIDENDQVKLFDEDLDKLQVSNSILRIPFRVLGWVTKKFAKGFKDLGKAVIGGMFKGGLWASKKMLGFIGQGIKKTFNWLSKPGDVYVVSRPKDPALRGELMKTGEYVTKSGKTVCVIDDIDGEVKDSKGEVKISEEDIKEGLIDGQGRPIKLSLTTKIFQTIGKVLGKVNRFFSYKRALKGVRTTIGKKPEDVQTEPTKDSTVAAVEGTTGKVEKTNNILSDIFTFLKEKINPAKLSAPVPESAAPVTPMKATPSVLGPTKKLKKLPVGGTKKSTKSLTKPSGIKIKAAASAAVKESSVLGPNTSVSTPEEQATAVNTEKTTGVLTEILNLVKSKFKPKKIIGDTDGDGVRENSVKDLIRKKGLLEAGKDKLKGAANTIKDKIAKKADEAGISFKLPGILGKMYDKFFGKKDPAIEVAEDSLDQLTQIKYLLAKQTIGGGGPDIPDGPDKKNKSRGSRTRPGRTIPGRGGMGGRITGRMAGMGGRASLGMLGPLAGTAMAGYSGYSAYNNFKEGNYVDGALDTGMAVGGAALTYATMGGTVAGASAALGTAGTTIAGGAAAVAGVISLPVVAAVAATALVGYGVYKGYKYFTKNNMSPIEKIRYVQYGFDKNKTDDVSKVLGLESYISDFVTVHEASGSVIINGSKIDIKEMMSPFGLDSKNEKDTALFMEWFQERFKPVYITHCTAMKGITGKIDLSKFSDFKDEEKKKYIDSIKFPEGPYGFTRLPSKDLDSDYKVSGSAEVTAVIEEVLKELKLDDSKGEKKLIEEKKDTNKTAPPLNTEESDAEQNPANDKDSLLNKDNKDKLKAMDKTVDVNSSVTKKMLVGDNQASPLEAIRFKAYGLVELDVGKVRALKQLEKEVNLEVTYKDNKIAGWNGSPIKLLDKMLGSFGITDVLGKEAGDWASWFTNRFLPVYTGYLTGFMVYTGKPANENSSDNLLKPIQRVDLSVVISGLSGVWSSSRSPWPGYILNTDSNSVVYNIEFLKSVAKEAKITEDKKAYSPKPTVDPKLNTPKTEGVLDVKKPEQTVYNNEIYSESAEVKPKKTTNIVSEKSNIAGYQQPSMVGGPLADGSSGVNAIKLDKGVSLDGVNPEFLKLFNGMVQEYNEKTKKNIIVTSGFRTYEQQVAAKKKHGASAATPGNSMHEFGLAIDADSDALDEMEKLGLMKKYGLTRPVGGEDWHIEPAGLQTRPDGFKRNSGASEAIKSSVGRGGGGLGTVPGAKRYSRNTAMAMKLLSAPTDPNVKDEVDKKINSSLPVTNIGAGRGNINPSNVTQEANAYDQEKNTQTAYVAPTVEEPVNGENKPAPVTDVGSADLDKKENKMPADPTVKIPAITKPGVEGVKEVVKASAKFVGVDENIALSTVAVESDFKPNASGGGAGAKGLYQFLDSTWDEQLNRYGNKYGLETNASPFDAKANSILGANYIKQNNSSLSKNIKGEVGPTEIYLSHFLGLSGAIKFLMARDSDPSQIGAKLFSAAAKSNKNIFYDKSRPRTIGEIYDYLKNKVNEKAKLYGINLPDSNKTKSTNVKQKVQSDSSPNISTTNAPKLDVKRDNVIPNNVKSANTELLTHDEETTDNTPTDKLIKQTKPTAKETMSSLGKSPMNENYGFNPALFNKKEEVNQNVISKELFKTTETLLGQSLEVEKQMLDVLKKMFGVMSTNTPNKEDMPTKEAPIVQKNTSKPQQQGTYIAPRVPIPMMKSIA